MEFVERFQLLPLAQRVSTLLEDHFFQTACSLVDFAEEKNALAFWGLRFVAMATQCLPDWTWTPLFAVGDFETKDANLFDLLLIHPEGVLSEWVEILFFSQPQISLAKCAVVTLLFLAWVDQELLLV